MKIRLAQSDDLDAITALLGENALPASDINAAALHDFLVAEDSHGAIVGCVAVELFGHAGLLRSLAVVHSARSSGLGSHLLSHAEQTARARGVLQLWLLTTTASKFFEGKRYVTESRSLAPADLQASSQFAGLCPSTAVCLTKPL